MNNCLVNFSVIEDKRGSLVPLEALKNIPFEIKRIYYIYNTSSDCQEGFMLIKNYNRCLFVRVALVELSLMMVKIKWNIY